MRLERSTSLDGGCSYCTKSKLTRASYPVKMCTEI
jgi:hypothetical protein